MFTTLIASSLLISVYGASIPDKFHLNGRIFGGHAISIDQAPYQVAYEHKGFQMCGGSIISTTFVLTAAHCTKGADVADAAIRAGSAIRNSGGSEHKAAQIINHSSFTLSPVANYDISLIKVSTPFVYSATVKAISLATAVPAVGSSVVTSGWGLTEHLQLSPQLLQVQVNVVSQADCNKAYSNNIQSTMVCAGVPQGGKDSCGGDSGGPLAHGSELVGIVSFGNGCGVVDNPGVYASVPHFRSWIKENSGV